MYLKAFWYKMLAHNILNTLRITDMYRNSWKHPLIQQFTHKPIIYNRCRLNRNFINDQRWAILLNVVQGLFGLLYSTISTYHQLPTPPWAFPLHYTTDDRCPKEDDGREFLHICECKILNYPIFIFNKINFEKFLTWWYSDVYSRTMAVYVHPLCSRCNVDCAAEDC